MKFFLEGISGCSNKVHDAELQREHFYYIYKSRDVDKESHDILWYMLTEEETFFKCY